MTSRPRSASDGPLTEPQQTLDVGVFKVTLAAALSAGHPMAAGAAAQRGTLDHSV